ncbi:MAG: hypothetical protein E7313_06840 [Clostridiales bacterium]|nr:hypothetical protein [Clostridiales bacterium]
MQKEKSIGRNILIIFLIIVMIASVCAALFAWAKYQTTINGTATGETAKWSFKVSDGDTSTQEIELPMTRTDNNSSVADGKIAPGTYGKIEIGIDATGTETALTYVIEGMMENRPTNMKFYLDEERTLDLTVLNDKFSKGGYMKLNEVGVREETIYWEWPFETVTCPQITDEKLTSLGIDKVKYETFIAEKKFTEANDMLDTAESDMQVSMKVSVTGKQLNGNPVLADLVQVGDYVNYNASSNGLKTFTSADCTNLAGTSISATISTDEDFNSEAPSQWRVLSVDKKTGNINLVAVDPTAQTVQLSGGNGFTNAETVLNNVGAIYGHGKGAMSGRSMNLEDVEQYSIYDRTLYKYENGFEYKATQSYTSGKFYKEEKNESDDVLGYEAMLTEATENNPVEMTQTYYRYEAQNYFLNEKIYNMIFKKSTDISSNKLVYWIASRCVFLSPTSARCLFNVNYIDSGFVSSDDLYYSHGYEISPSYPCMPVVSLESNIQTTGQDANGVWQLDV